MISPIFWLILGLGIAIPFTSVCILNILIKVKNPDNYELDLSKLSIVYMIALIGWALTLGVR